MKANELRRHLEDFEAYNISRNLSPKTIEEYRITLTRFFDYLGGKGGLDIELDPRSIRHFAADKLQNGNSPNTVRQYLVALRSLFSFLIADGIIDEWASPMRLVRDPKPDCVEIRPLTPEEAKALLDSFKKDKFKGLRNYVMCALILDTGLRAGEITCLNIGDLSLDHGRISVNGKGRKRRTVYVGRRMKAILEDYLEKRRLKVASDHPTLFPPTWPSHRATMRPHSFSEMVRKQLDSIGVPRCNSSAHRLRHTFAVSFIRNGGDAFSLQRFLGHSSLEMTRRYVLLADGDLQEAHRKASPMDGLDF